MNSMKLFGFGPSKPPPMPTQVRFSGPVVMAAADQPLDRLEVGHAGQLEMRLDAAGDQPPQMLLDPLRAGRHDHLAIGVVELRAGQAGVAIFRVASSGP